MTLIPAPAAMPHTFILGGARSGKSRIAQTRAAASGLEVVVIATATAGDAEMAARIHQHQATRPAHWRLIEEPLQLALTLRVEAAPQRLLLVDCLTLWLTNLLCHPDPSQLTRETQALLQCLPRLGGPVILVSNEVGQGIVPLEPLARRFVDEAGWLHQHLVALCDHALLVVAGAVIPLK